VSTAIPPEIIEASDSVFTFKPALSDAVTCMPLAFQNKEFSLIRCENSGSIKILRAIFFVFSIYL